MSDLRYWFGGLGRILSNLARDPFRAPGDRMSFTRAWFSEGYRYENRPKVKSCHFLDLYPQAQGLSIDLGPLTFLRSNATPFELYCISCIALIRHPLRIFEIGTFDGATTWRLARICPTAEVLTLDLDTSSINEHQAATIASEVENAKNAGIGSQFTGKPESSRIRQLLGDSTKFDYSPYLETCDLVFVDACHDYGYAKADSQAALRLIRPGGLILWHDYVTGWPGVVRAVNELLQFSQFVISLEPR